MQKRQPRLQTTECCDCRGNQRTWRSQKRKNQRRRWESKLSDQDEEKADADCHSSRSEGGHRDDDEDTSEDEVEEEDTEDVEDEDDVAEQSADGTTTNGLDDGPVEDPVQLQQWHSVADRLTNAVALASSKQASSR